MNEIDAVQRQNDTGIFLDTPLHTDDIDRTTNNSDLLLELKIRQSSDIRKQEVSGIRAHSQFKPTSSRSDV